MNMIVLNILLGVVEAILLIGVIGERDKDKQKNITFAFVALAMLILVANNVI